MDLVEEVYSVVKNFPDEEKFGLINQMKRSSVSIPSNIAEGFMRQSTKEYIQFLYIALGSLGELDTQFELSKRLEYIDNCEKVNSNIKRIRMQLFGLIKRLKSKL